MNNPTGYYYIDNITNVSYVLAKINTKDTTLYIAIKIKKQHNM